MVQKSNEKFYPESDQFNIISAILISIFALIAGGVIYTLFRPTEFNFLNWFDNAGLSSWIDSLRNETIHLHLFPDWVVYSLPNGLWAFAYTLLIYIIWKRSSSVIKYFWFSSIPLLVLGFEFLQLFGFIYGTFSVQDIFIGIAGIVAAYAIGRLLYKSTIYEKNYI